jgi:hypothetical protein
VVLPIVIVLMNRIVAPVDQITAKVDGVLRNVSFWQGNSTMCQSYWL